MKDYTIAEDFVLPSLGKVYDKEINPNIKIRSMTTEDEMRRLGKTSKPHKLLCDIIDDCLVEKPEISSYDMCLADQQFILYKLRTVTYGSEYVMQSKCDVCGTTHETKINLDDMVCNNFTDEVKDLFEIDLPVSKLHIKLKLQTPHLLEDIDALKKEADRRHPNSGSESAFLFYIMSVIDEVDGNRLNQLELENLVRKLPMRDTNFINQKADKLTESFGMSMTYNVTCPVCGSDYECRFRISSEFFRPTLDE